LRGTRLEFDSIAWIEDGRNRRRDASTIGPRAQQDRVIANPHIAEGHLAVSNPNDFHAPQSSYTKEDLLKSSEGGYFGPGNAQLPAPPMLMMDRITEISVDGGEFGKGHIIAELDLTPDLWFFDCHFPGDPVMPGCLGLDAMWQIIGYWLGWSGSPGKGRAVGVGEVKFRGHITPEVRRVRYEVDIRQVRRGKLAVGIANGRVLADDTCVYVAKDIRVGLIRPAT
jgi:3-hydroxyacyl-[acyl-carrier protein] dehydratase/trans-2-decenoyl-[acyl-carrier protein] isomerase